MGFLHIGVDDVFEFLQRFPHDVDILNVQENELCILVLIALIPSPCGLGTEKDTSLLPLEPAAYHRSLLLFRSDLVGHGVDARPSVVDGQLGGIVRLPDQIQIALIILVSFPRHAYQRLAAAGDHCLILPVNP